MVEQLNSYKKMWNNFFDLSREEKYECIVDKEPSGAYGGYYDEPDRQMFQVSAKTRRRYVGILMDSRLIDSSSNAGCDSPMATKSTEIPRKSNRVIPIHG